ncbi:MAG: hypothetical protein HFE45_00230 [Oscillospiraceae bacterium]|nr:hypothetical protein [Oscillospiraceae bacterium]
MLSILLLLPALAADTLAAVVACAAKGIAIPLRSRLVMALVGSVFLLAAMLGGAGIGRILPENVCKAISFTVLFLLGISSLFRTFLQNTLKKLKNRPKKMQFNLLGLSFLLSICADETVADADGSNTLNGAEAAALAASLSLDSLAAGLAGGFSAGWAFVAAAACLPLQVGVIGLGVFLGRAAAEKFPQSLPELAGGFLLILLAFLRIL